MEGGERKKSKLEAERKMETAENNGTAEGEGGSKLKGQERASATTFSELGMWTILLVNSAM